ncbi:MAG: hypothetical protein AAFR38_13820 [Planctomycetota bacterium]
MLDAANPREQQQPARDPADRRYETKPFGRCGLLTNQTDTQQGDQPRRETPPKRQPKSAR